MQKKVKYEDVGETHNLNPDLTQHLGSTTGSQLQGNNHSTENAAQTTATRPNENPACPVASLGQSGARGTWAAVLLVSSFDGNCFPDKEPTEA